MRNVLFAAALAIAALAGITAAQARYCTTTCTPTYGGGMSCTQSCF